MCYDARVIKVKPDSPDEEQALQHIGKAHQPASQEQWATMDRLHPSAQTIV
jgi:hypothetical protein